MPSSASCWGPSAAPISDNTAGRLRTRWDRSATSSSVWWTRSAPRCKGSPRATSSSRHSRYLRRDVRELPCGVTSHCVAGGSFGNHGIDGGQGWPFESHSRAAPSFGSRASVTRTRRCDHSWRSLRCDEHGPPRGRERRRARRKRGRRRGRWGRGPLRGPCRAEARSRNVGSPKRFRPVRAPWMRCRNPD
jgi:hypothetical protein